MELNERCPYCKKINTQCICGMEYDIEKDEWVYNPEKDPSNKTFMDNKNKIILDLCGGTGSWSKPYKDAGYDVRLITWPENDVRMYEPSKNVYGILAAPPCTMFSLARTRAKTPRDFREGMELVMACLRIIWTCRHQNKLAFWALENPMGYLRQFLGKPPLTFDPCDFGDPYTKKTDLWGYYNMPKKKPVELNDKQKARCSNNTRKLPILKLISNIKIYLLRKLVKIYQI